jgi:regulator of replication initiation timing
MKPLTFLTSIPAYLRLLPHHLLYRLSSTYRHHSTILTQRDELQSTVALYTAKLQSLSTQLDDLEAESQNALAELSKTTISLNQCREENSRLAHQISTLKRELQTERTARLNAHNASLVDKSRADQFQSLYIAECEDHKRSLKAEVNWRSLATSTRTPVYDGVGPTPPPRLETVIPPGTQGPLRASAVSRAHSLAVIEEVQARQSELAQEVQSLDDGTLSELTDSAATLAGAGLPLQSPAEISRQLEDLWAETNPGTTPPWKVKTA